jgi:peptide methionine sulfoxide reductase MsrB
MKKNIFFLLMFFIVGYLLFSNIISASALDVASSHCTPACASNETCKQTDSGSYQCAASSALDVASSHCTPACASNETCKQTDSGSYQCAASSSTSSTATSFANPLQFDTVQGFFGSVLSALQQIIVVLSIIFIIIGGVLYITSAGNEERMKTAKGAITASMIGLAIGIAAPSFLKEVYSIMGGKVGDTSALVGPTLTQIALNFLNFLLSIVGILGLIMLIIGGIMYLTSAGSEERIKSAKNIVLYSIVGIAISLAALVIVKQIANLLK